jgi:hypothetical protein
MMRKILVTPELLVFATGYNRNIPPQTQVTSLAEDNKEHLEIWKQTVGFIGFVPPNFGLVSPLSSNPRRSYQRAIQPLSESTLAEIIPLGHDADPI